MILSRIVRSAFVMLVVTASVAAAEPRLVIPRGDRLMGEGLARAAAADPSRPIKVWVFLTDKGIHDPAQLRGALSAAEWGWPARSLARRAGAGIPLDFSDLPVHDPYVRRLRVEGFAVERESRWLNAVSLRAPAGRLRDLEAFPFVRYVQPVLVKRGADRLPDVEELDAAPGVLGSASVPSPALEAWYYGPSYNQLDQIQALDLHRLGYTGAGVRVMVLDTGFRKSHRVFQTCTNVVAEYDFVNDDADTENEAGDPSSAHNHGTGCWAVLGGFEPGALIGPAWAAEFVLAKTEDVASEVRSEEDDYVAALEWGDTLGVDVASASLAYFDFDNGFTYTLADLDGDTAVITRAVDMAAAKGMVCVNAMGNSGPSPSTLMTPADADSVIAVGAVDSLGSVSTFSSRGPTGDGRTKPEIVARGSLTYWARAWTGGYGPASGTSLSTPLIGGLAALIKEAQPTWGGHEIRTALMATGSQAGAPDNDKGWGIARGVDAIHHAGAVPEPPRMTLPFALCEPAEGAVLGTAVPQLTWSPSEAGRPGDAAHYTVFLERDGSIDSLDAGADTSLVLPYALAPGDSVSWWVHAVGELGFVRKSMDSRSFSISATLAAQGPPEPVSLGVLGAFPNPTRSGASIRFRAPRNETVLLDLITASGRLVRRFHRVGTGGPDAIAWDGRDEEGREVPPGVLFYRIEGRSGADAGKLVRVP